MRSCRVSGYTDYLDSEFLKLWNKSREILGFESTSWSVILWIEIEEGFVCVREEVGEIHRVIFWVYYCMDYYLS